jgi:folate-dependent phosphoribosylglycinamide formyltransferase PurN
MTGTPKKIALYLGHDLVGLLMLNKIVPEMKRLGLEPVIFNTGTHNNKKFKHPSPFVVSAFNVRALEGVIMPFLEKTGMAAAGPNLTYKQLAKKYDVQYREIEDVNDPMAAQEIAADTDFIGAVSVRLLQVFGSRMIETFSRKGFMWNLHSGLLPDYKGLLTPYRAIENNASKYGLTLHEMATGIDEGGIIAMRELPLDRDRPVLDLYLDTVDVAGQMMADSLARVAKGNIPAGARQSPPGSYYSNPTAGEFRSYVEKGIFYIDPERTLQRIVDSFTWAGTAQNKALKENMHGFLEGQPQLPKLRQAQS